MTAWGRQDRAVASHPPRLSTRIAGDIRARPDDYSLGPHLSFSEACIYLGLPTIETRAFLDLAGLPRRRIARSTIDARLRVLQYKSRGQTTEAG